MYTHHIESRNLTGGKQDNYRLFLLVFLDK